MKKDSFHPNAREYITDLAAKGRYHFTSIEARSALGVSADAAKLALNRLAKQMLIAMPARGFYIILPPEYQSLGCLPAEQFIPAFMQHLDQPYYAGLLSAAQYHGAAHHRPQEFQVVIAKTHRPIRCGSVRVAFITRKQLMDVPVQHVNTPRGTLKISTPEATAIDLVGYLHHIGGLDQAATILSELAEKIDPEKLLLAAKTAPIPWAQRLGYLLELVHVGDTINPLKEYVREYAKQNVFLLPTLPHESFLRDKDWKLFINAEVEIES